MIRNKLNKNAKKIDKFLLKFLKRQKKSLLIQPLIGQYKKGEYKDAIILSLNKKIVIYQDTVKDLCLGDYSVFTNSL